MGAFNSKGRERTGCVKHVDNIFVEDIQLGPCMVPTIAQVRNVINGTSGVSEPILLYSNVLCQTDHARGLSAGRNSDLLSLLATYFDV